MARQFLTESVVVTAIGSSLGLAVAYWGSKLLVSKAPRSIPRASEIGIDGNVLLFLLALSVITAVIFGVLPALQMSKGMPIASLRDWLCARLEDPLDAEVGLLFGVEHD